MPVICTKDSKGCFCRWGEEGKKYYYKCNSTKEKVEAAAKAAQQGRAIKASQN